MKSLEYDDTDTPISTLSTVEASAIKPEIHQVDEKPSKDEADVEWAMKSVSSIGKQINCWAWQGTFIFPALGRQGQLDLREFKASLPL